MLVLQRGRHVGRPMVQGGSWPLWARDLEWKEAVFAVEHVADALGPAVIGVRSRDEEAAAHRRAIRQCQNRGGLRFFDLELRAGSVLLHIGRAADARRLPHPALRAAARRYAPVLILARRRGDDIRTCEVRK